MVHEQCGSVNELMEMRSLWTFSMFHFATKFNNLSVNDFRHGLLDMCFASVGRLEFERLLLLKMVMHVI